MVLCGGGGCCENDFNVIVGSLQRFLDFEQKNII